MPWGQKRRDREWRKARKEVGRSFADEIAGFVYTYGSRRSSRQTRGPRASKMEGRQAWNIKGREFISRRGDLAALPAERLFFFLGGRAACLAMPWAKLSIAKARRGRIKRRGTGESNELKWEEDGAVVIEMERREERCAGGNGRTEKCLYQKD